MREYACIMLDYEQPEFIKEIQKKIPEDEIYFGETKEEKENNEYALEEESHITIAYGLENHVKFDDIKEYLFPLDEYKTILVNVSVFENKLFDVLKVDARCPKAAESNKLIQKDYVLHTEFKDFHPHMTIAYLKKGFADKYKKSILDKIEDLKPYRFNYSYDIDGENKNDFYKKID